MKISYIQFLNEADNNDLYHIINDATGRRVQQNLSAKNAREFVDENDNHSIVKADPPPVVRKKTRR